MQRVEGRHIIAQQRLRVSVLLPAVNLGYLAKYPIFKPLQPLFFTQGWIKYMHVVCDKRCIGYVSYCTLIEHHR